MAQGNSRILGWRIYPVGRMERCSAAPLCAIDRGYVARTACDGCARGAWTARYTGVGASGRHPRPRKGLRPPRHRSCHRQDDLFSCPGERTTGAYGCAVGIAGRGARHDRSPDSPAHSRDARQPRYRSTETTGQGAAGGASRSVTRRDEYPVRRWRGSKIALFQKAKPFVSGGRVYELLQVCHWSQKRGDWFQLFRVTTFSFGFLKSPSRSDGRLAV